MIKKNHILLWIILGCLALGIALHLYETYFLNKYNYHGIKPGDIVLIITVGAVFGYAWETKKMREEMVNQTINSTMPILSFYATRVDRSFYLQNFSKFTAYDLRIHEKKVDEDLKLVFKKVDVVLPGQRVPVDVEILKNQKIITGEERANLLVDLVKNKDFAFSFETSSTFKNNHGLEYTKNLTCGIIGRVEDLILTFV